MEEIDLVEIDLVEEGNPLFKDLLRDYKELDIEIKERKLGQDKLRLQIFDLMKKEDIDKFANNFGTAYFSKRFNYDKKKAIAYYLENDPSMLETTYKLKVKAEAKLMTDKELDFGQGFNEIKQIRLK